MGLRSSTQPGSAYKLPTLPQEFRRELQELPEKYIQTNLFEPKPEAPENAPRKYLKGDLEALEGTGLFDANLINHIFNGDVKRASAGKGKKRQEATGFHSEAVQNADGKVVPGTRGEPDENGVYKAQVTVKGIRKRRMGGCSTFFPRHWSPQRVVDAINEAYRNKALVAGTLYKGNVFGIKIMMRINSIGKIESAYPAQKES